MKAWIKEYVEGSDDDLPLFRQQIYARYGLLGIVNRPDHRLTVCNDSYTLTGLSGYSVEVESWVFNKSLPDLVNHAPRLIDDEEGWRKTLDRAVLGKQWAENNLASNCTRVQLVEEAQIRCQHLTDKLDRFKHEQRSDVSIAKVVLALDAAHKYAARLIVDSEFSAQKLGDVELGVQRAKDRILDVLRQSAENLVACEVLQVRPERKGSRVVWVSV